MNNNDERDFAEEAANRQILETRDGEIDDGPQHWLHGGTNEWERRLTRSYGREMIDAPYDETEIKVAALLGHPARTFEYYFLFGFGHKLIVCLPESGYRPDPKRQEGFSLSGYYVKIEATDEHTAREEFVRLWGEGNFSSVHDDKSFERLCSKHTYKELQI
jgi:hypothetical protein